MHISIRSYKKYLRFFNVNTDKNNVIFFYNIRYILINIFDPYLRLCVQTINFAIVKIALCILHRELSASAK